MLHQQHYSKSTAACTQMKALLPEMEEPTVVAAVAAAAEANDDQTGDLSARRLTKSLAASVG